MKVIRPITFDRAAHLIATSAVESYVPWGSGTTYAAGDTIIYDYSIYESLQSANTNKTPTTNPTWWLLIGPANSVAMFDSQTSTSTTATDSLGVTVKVPNISAVAFAGVSCSELSLVVRDGFDGDILYDETADLSDPSISDWYSYFFSPIVPRSVVVFEQIPPMPDTVLYVTATGSGTVSIATMVYGSMCDIGPLNFGAKVGIVDYSKKDVDEYGTITLTRRAFSRKLSGVMMVPNIELPGLLDTLENLRATPTVWVGHDQLPYATVLSVFGFYRDFTIDIAYPADSLCSLELESLT